MPEAEAFLRIASPGDIRTACRVGGGMRPSLVAPGSENGSISLLMRSVRASLMHPPRAAGSRQPICSARATMMPAGPRR